MDPVGAASAHADKAAAASRRCRNRSPRIVFEIDPTTDVVGVVQKTLATKDDTLTDIARRFNVGYEEIVRANPGVDPWLPGENREIVIPSQFILPNAPREGIVINVPAMRLFYYPKVKKGEKQVVHTYPIGVGRVGWATPEGATKIVRAQKDPIWRPTASIIKEHKENGEILDKRRTGGSGQSARPLRVLPRLAQLHDPRHQQAVGRGPALQPWLHPPVSRRHRAVVQDGGGRHARCAWSTSRSCSAGTQGSLHIQAYDVLEDDTRDWKKAQVKLLKKDLAERIQKELAARNEKIDWDAVSQLTHDPRGIPVSISGGPDSLGQIVASATLVQNKVAPGATWDGVSDLPVDEATFQELMSDREPPVEAASAAAPTTKPVAN